jgi:thymidine kinase
MISLIIGPMFAGKTSELLRLIEREKYSGRSCCVVKFSRDKRYSDEHVITHEFRKKEINFSVTSLKGIENEWKVFDTIAIDEGQFFPDIVEFVSMVSDMGKRVIISALDADFQRKPFGRILELIPMAEHVMKLSAICMLCGKDAYFSKRISCEKEIEVIGGSEKYMAVCRQCYLK